MQWHQVNIFTGKNNFLIFFVFHLATTLSLDDESTGLLPRSMAATQSLEGQPLAAGHCGMLPHTYRFIFTEYCAKRIIICIFPLQHRVTLADLDSDCVNRVSIHFQHTLHSIMHIFCSATPGLPAAGRPGSINIF